MDDKANGITKFDNEVFLLPQDADKVIIQALPTFRITSIIPSLKRTISVNGQTHDVKTPPLAFVQTLWRSKHDGDYHTHNFRPEACRCDYCRYTPRFMSEFLIYSLKIAEDGLFGKPFTMANVYAERGLVCWGEFTSRQFSWKRTPDNLRHAYSIFWSAPFNMDTWPAYRSHQERGCPDPHLCQTLRRGGRCAKRHSCPATAESDSVGIKEHIALCTHSCESFRKANKGEIGAAHKTIGDCENFATSDSKLICPTLCCFSLCSCSASWCRCCSRSCQCRSNCSCCNAKCACKCRCNLSERFVAMVKDYDPDDIAVVWADMSNFFLGDEFIGSSQKEEAAFYSSHPKVLEATPAKYHKANSVNRFVCGLASKTQDGWEIFIGEDCTLSLKDSEVNINAINGRKDVSLDDKVEASQQNMAFVAPTTPGLQDYSSTFTITAGIGENRGGEAVMITPSAPVISFDYDYYGFERPSSGQGRFGYGHDGYDIPVKTAYRCKQRHMHIDQEAVNECNKERRKLRGKRTGKKHRRR